MGVRQHGGDPELQEVLKVAQAYLELQRDRIRTRNEMDPKTLVTSLYFRNVPQL